MDQKRCVEKRMKFTWLDEATRHFAVLELVLSIAALMVLLLNTYIAVLASTKEPTDEKAIEINKRFEHFGFVGLWWTWVVVASFALVVGLHLFVSLNVLSSTYFDSEKDYDDIYKTLRKIRICWNVTIVLVLMQVVTVFHYAYYMCIDESAGSCLDGCQSMLPKFSFILWRANYMMTVLKLKRDLEAVSVSVVNAESGNTSMGEVLVKKLNAGDGSTCGHVKIE